MSDGKLYKNRINTVHNDFALVHSFGANGVWGDINNDTYLDFSLVLLRRRPMVVSEVCQGSGRNLLRCWDNHRASQPASGAP